MSFPSYAAFAKDSGITLTRWRVYMTLQPPFLDFLQPRAVKIVVLAEALRFEGRRHGRRRTGASREDVGAAVDWLVQRGYLTEHGRDARGVRCLTITYALPVSAPDVPNPSGVAGEPPRSRTA